MIYLAGTDFSHLTTDELIKGIKALKLPDYIRSKAYGVDVRETLAQMIEMLMQLAYNQGMTPQQAQDWVSQLNNKIIKGQVTMNDLTQEVKEALTGGSVAVVGVDAVGTVNLQNNAVTPDKTSFMENGTNIFNKNTAIIGVFISGNASTSNLEGYFTSQPIYSKVDQKYTISKVRNYRLIDGSGNRYGVTEMGNNSALATIEVPAGHGFEFSGAVSNLDTTQVNIGDAALPYESYYVKFNENVKITNENLDVSDSGSNIKISGNNVSILDGELEQALDLKGSRNNAFSFRGTYFNGEKIHPSEDDITPPRLPVAVGANHGWTTEVLPDEFDSLLSNGQLYPSTKNLEQSSSSNNGVFILTEKYDILDDNSIVSNGTDYANNLANVDAKARLVVSYRFYGVGKCTVHSTLIILKDTESKTIGFLQSEALRGNVTRYMPGVKPIGSNDFENGVILADYTENLNVYSENLQDTTKPPLFYSDVRNDITFTMGYVPIATGSPVERLNNTDTYWDLRGTKKSYPVALGKGISPLKAGDVFENVGFRNYSKPDKDLEIFETVETTDAHYIYIYSKSPKNYLTKLVDSSIHGVVEVVQSRGFELISDNVGAGSITFSTPAKGYAVLKVDK